VPSIECDRQCGCSGNPGVAFRGAGMPQPGSALAMQGNRTDAAHVLRALVDEAQAAQIRVVRIYVSLGSPMCFIPRPRNRRVLRGTICAGGCRSHRLALRGRGPCGFRLRRPRRRCGRCPAMVRRHVAVAPGFYRMLALTARAFVAIAQGEPDQARRDAHDAPANRRSNIRISASS